MQHIQTKSQNEIILHLALARITFLKYNEKIFLSKKLDSPRCLVLLSIEDISKLINRKISSRVNWDGKENWRMAELALHYCNALGIHIIFYDSDEYPDLLKEIEDPPFLLFARGNKDLLKCPNKVSVVGTRRISQAGKEAARKFAYDAVAHGCVVVSGLANGADGFAHNGAVDASFDFFEKGKLINGLGGTIAVLPCAIDEIVPSGHKVLAGKIIQCGGCLISEYEPKMSMANWHFVGRNRIIAGLSQATVVVEAPPGSGALITADFALENGRDVMFHECSFKDQALEITRITKKGLDADFAAGKVSKYKVENTAEKYIEAGAPVIKDYNDYCECISEEPGKRAQSYIQGELFQ